MEEDTITTIDAEAKIEKDVEIVKTMTKMKILMVMIKYDKETVKIAVRTMKVDTENH